MSFPTRRQFTTSVQASLTSTANTYTFSSVAVAGNLLVVCLAGDKNTGTVTVSDNISGATGWTIETSIPGASVSLYVARKVAVGGENVVTATTSAASTTGNSGYAEEMVDDGAGAWMVVAKVTPVYNDTARVSATSGTTDTADYDGRALAIGVIDSLSSLTADTGPTFTNFTRINVPGRPTGSGGGNAGCYIGEANLAAAATTSTTFATNGGTDQLTVAIVALGRVETVAAPTVDAGVDVAQHTINTEFTRTAGETGSGITTRAWTITAGPAGVGTTIGTAAALSWTPTTLGTYTLQYAATNPQGTGTDPMSITVTSGVPGTLTSSWLGIDKVGLVLSGGTGAVRVDFSTSSGMTSPTASVDVTPDGLGNAQVPIPAGLTPDSTYFYRAFRGGSYLGTATQFRTLPASGSFSFGFASCRSHDALEPSPNPTALADVKTRGADLFLQTGDIHYRDISTNTPASFRTGFDELYTRSNFAALLTTVPTAYIWSDHDYGGDASYSGTASRPAAQSVYRERVPSPTLPSATGGIYHTFVVGRVRFIMLDTRSYRSIWTATDNSSKTMLGIEQKAWLQNLLATVTEPISFVVSDVGWIGGGGEDDHWGAYNTERSEIAPWISAAQTEVVMLCGDAHMLAIDNGSNAAGGCHVWHAAALNRFTSTKGGPYSGGTFPGNNQYGYVTISDTGSSISATYQGIKSDTTVWNTDVVTVTSAANSGAFLLFFG